MSTGKSPELGKIVQKYHSQWLPGYWVVFFSILFLGGVVYALAYTTFAVGKQARGKDLFISFESWLHNSVLSHISHLNVLMLWIGGFLFAIIITAVLTKILIQYCTVNICRGGIQGYSYQSFSCQVLWEEIEKVSSNPFHINLHDSQAKVILTIPNGWLHHFDDMKRDVIEQAGEDHPLSQYFLNVHF